MTVYWHSTCHASLSFNSFEGSHSISSQETRSPRVCLENRSLLNDGLEFCTKWCCKCWKAAHTTTSRSSSAQFAPHQSNSQTKQTVSVVQSTGSLPHRSSHPLPAQSGARPSNDTIRRAVLGPCTRQQTALCSAYAECNSATNTAASRNSANKVIHHTCQCMTATACKTCSMKTPWCLTSIREKA